MISRIGHSRGRPVAQGFGKRGAITSHSASVRSVWYRVTVRLCCCRVVGVHMTNPRLVREILTAGASGDFGRIKSESEPPENDQRKLCRHLDWGLLSLFLRPRCRPRPTRLKAAAVVATAVVVATAAVVGMLAVVVCVQAAVARVRSVPDRQYPVLRGRARAAIDLWPTITRRTIPSAKGRLPIQPATKRARRT
jgi:hypothetical protein